MRGTERFTDRSVAAAWLNPPDDRCRRRDPVRVGTCDFRAEQVRGSVCKIVSGCVGEGKKPQVPAGSERGPSGVTAFLRRAGRSGGGKDRTGSVARAEETAVRSQAGIVLRGPSGSRSPAAGCPAPAATGPGCAAASGGAVGGPGEELPAGGGTGAECSGTAAAFRSGSAGLRRTDRSDHFDSIAPLWPSWISSY